LWIDANRLDVQGWAGEPVENPQPYTSDEITNAVKYLGAEPESGANTRVL
jgi:hypothetical protein